MILLTAAKMPSELDKNTLSCAVRSMFSNPLNESYINEISSRANESSAVESLFALALLYDLILSLPCHNTHPSSLVLARAEGGKPYFKDSEIKFNVSHSKGYVACAVSFGEELGVDIEASDVSHERAKKLAKRYFNEAEAERSKISPKIFKRYWSEKEAKAKFLGISLPEQG